jgi:hypothetical protein
MQKDFSNIINLHQTFIIENLKVLKPTTKQFDNQIIMFPHDDFSKIHTYNF